LDQVKHVPLLVLEGAEDRFLGFDQPVTSGSASQITTGVFKSLH